MAATPKPVVAATHWVLIKERLYILRIKAIEDKEDNVKDIFYERFKQAFKSLSVYDMELLLENFSAQG